MVKSRLDHLFGDLTKRHYGLVSKETLAMCRNEFNQMLKLAGWHDIATPSLKRLLEDADYGLFNSATSMVQSAQLDYTNLNKRIAEVNTLEERNQQEQVRIQFRLNTHLRQNDEHDTGIPRGPQNVQQSDIVSQYQMHGNSDTPLKPTAVGSQYPNKSEANILIHNTPVTIEQTIKPQCTFMYPQVSNSNRFSDTNSTFQGEQVTQPSNITQVQGLNPTQISLNNLLDGCLNNVNKDYPLKEQVLSTCRSETAMSKHPTGRQSTVPTLDNKITEDVDSCHNMSNETATYSAAVVNISDKITSLQNNVKTDTNSSNQVPNKGMINHSTNTRSQQPNTGNCNGKESEASKLSRSRAASAQLRRNNPNIVDLSDNNRPTKLAEKFCEMYDNEWTEAFECLDTNCKQQEKTIIGLLLDIITFSKNETVRIVKIMENAFDSVLEHGNVGNCNDNASPAVPRIQREFCEKLPVIYRNFYVKDVPVSPGNPIITYANRCVELTWWMCVQDPPIYMDTAETMMMPMFNAATYKAYTKTGRKIDYYVWPALLLEQGGAVLMKGVAQCV